MKCILLCAGYSMDDSLKLQETASSLLRVHDKPLINYTIEALEPISSIDEIYVITNGVYYPKFLQWQEQYTFSKKVTVINDNTTSSEAKLGAIGDIRYTINTQNIDEDLMVLAGDAYFDFSLNDFVEFYLEKKKTVVAGMTPMNDEDFSRYGVLETSDDIVVGMQEKPIDPQGNMICLSAYILPREVLRDFEYYLSEGNLTTYPGYFIEYLYKLKTIYAYEIIGNYYVVKTASSVRALEQRLERLH